MYLSLSTLIFVVLVLALLGAWQDSARAREAANQFATDVCRRRSLQLLDGTVALASLRPRLDKAGLRIERTYVFDYTADEIARERGLILMVGHEITRIVL